MQTVTFTFLLTLQLFCVQDQTSECPSTKVTFCTSNEHNPFYCGMLAFVLFQRFLSQLYGPNLKPYSEGGIMEESESTTHTRQEFRVPPYMRVH